MSGKVHTRQTAQHLRFIKPFSFVGSLSLMCNGVCLCRHNNHIELTKCWATAFGAIKL